MARKSQEKNKDLIIGSYTPKRKMLEKVIKLAYGRVTPKTQERMEQCSTYLQFVATFDKSHKKVVGSNSCGNRYCPVCNWNKARKDGMMLSILMQAIKDRFEYEYIFLTLTVPNVPASELEEEIKAMNKAFNAMSRLKAFKQAVKGYVRKFEVTYNKERNDYHPHFHVLIAVNKSYFNNSKLYISQGRWLDMWRNATGKIGVDENGIDEITQLDVRKVKGGKSDNAFKEMAKYSTKDSDMIVNQEVFDTLYHATKGKRTIVYAGIFKDFKRLYEKGELKEYLAVDENDYYWFVRSTWDNDTKQYESIYQEMSEDEKKLFNKRKQTEIDID